jgi:hypothetical protein
MSPEEMEKTLVEAIEAETAKGNKLVRYMTFSPLKDGTYCACALGMLATHILGDGSTTIDRLKMAQRHLGLTTYEASVFIGAFDDYPVTFSSEFGARLARKIAERFKPPAFAEAYYQYLREHNVGWRGDASS